MRLPGLLFLGASAMWAQGGSVGFTPPNVKPAGLTGAPFSAEEEYVRGDQITKGRRIFRDSEGRIRTERLMVPGGKQYIVEISDPVLGASWVLDTQHKIAHLMAPQPPPPAAPPATSTAPPPPPPPQPQVTNESLDTKEIDGVKVVGNRSTTVYLEGQQNVIETWFSPELQIMLRSRSDDDIFRLANLSRKVPFPSMFRVPADHTIVEEKTTFVVQYQ